MNAHIKHNPAEPHERLPEGEVFLWQGRPDWRSFARQAFHVRKVAIYFGLLLVSRFLLELFGIVEFSVTGAVWLAIVGFVAIGTLALLARVYARTTSYIITNNRIVMKFGVALPITFTIPLRDIAAAAARIHGDGTVDIPLQLKGNGRPLTYVHLWPNARPWHLTVPQPMLRSVPEGTRVMGILTNALQAASAKPSIVGQSNSEPAATSPVRTNVAAAAA